MTDDLNPDDAFAERIAEPLRAEERADATFEARVMSGVHALARAHDSGTASSRERTWWLRPYEIRLTPLASLALAAGLAALVLGGAAALGLMERGRSANPGTTETQTAARRSVDTVHLVRFVLTDPTARNVTLVGTFNSWQKGATPLRPSSVNGVWTVSVPLSAGKHEYAFIVSDGTRERWVADPFGEPLLDDFGTESSLILVERKASS